MVICDRARWRIKSQRPAPTSGSCAATAQPSWQTWLTIRTSTSRITVTAIANGCRFPEPLSSRATRNTIRELYAPDWKVWFPDEGDARHGTPDDPRLVLIGVTVHGAEFLEVDKPQPVILFELVKGWLTGSEPELGKMHELVEPRRP